MYERSTLIVQCLDLTKQLMKTDHKATINIMVGDVFKYEFSNQDIAASAEKKNQSPSQRRRNYERQMCYNLKQGLARLSLESRDRDWYLLISSLVVETETETMTP